MKYYIIREQDGGWLPQRMANFTSSEPTTVEPPRLFVEERSAKISLSMWRKGEHHKEHRGGGSFNDDYEEWIEITPIPRRLRMKMEVVPIQITPYQP